MKKIGFTQLSTLLVSLSFVCSHLCKSQWLVGALIPPLICSFMVWLVPSNVAVIDIQITYITNH